MSASLDVPSAPAGAVRECFLTTTAADRLSAILCCTGYSPVPPALRGKRRHACNFTWILAPTGQDSSHG